MSDLQDRLVRLESAGLVRIAQLEPELEYLFRHALVQEATYHAILRQDRRALHRVVGETLESLYPEQREDLAPQLAAHFDEAGDEARALVYFTLAGDSAAARYANPEAIMSYSRAIEIALAARAEPERLLHLFTRKGRACELSGRFDEALATYEQLEAQGRQRAERSLELAAIMARATIHATFTPRFDPERGVALSNQALEIARAIGDEAAQAKIHWNLLLVYRSTGQLPPALEHGQKSLEIARRLGLKEQLAFTLHDLSGLRISAGDLKQGLDEADEARTLWRKLNNKVMLADNLTTTAQMLALAGKVRETFEMAQEAVDISRSIGNLWGEANGLMVAAMAQLYLGNLHEALQLLETCIPIAETGGFGFAQTIGQSNLAVAYLYLGDYDRARLHAQDAITRAEQMMPEVVVLGQATLGLVAAAQGDLKAARARLPKLKQMEITTDLFALMFATPIVASIHNRLGEFQVVIEATDRILSIVAPEIVQHSVTSCQLLLVRAQALRGAGRLDEARETLRTVVSTVDAAQSQFLRWDALAELWLVEQAAGNEKQAKKHLQEARAALKTFIKTIGDQALEASFRARPDVARLLSTT